MAGPSIYLPILSLKKRNAPLIVIACAVGLIMGGLACEEGQPKETSSQPRTAVPAPTLPEGWARYHNSTYGYSIGHPPNWPAEEHAALGITEFTSPEGVNCNVGVGRSTATEVGAYVAANRIGADEGALYLSEGPLELNGRQGFEVVVTLPQRFFGFSGKDRLLTRQAVFVAKGNGYVVACTAFEFETAQYRDTFSTLMNTFVITHE